MASRIFRCSIILDDVAYMLVFLFGTDYIDTPLPETMKLLGNIEKQQI